MMKRRSPLAIRSWPKKPQLVQRVRTAEQRLLEAQQQVAVQAEAGVKREARIAELEPYRTFVEQMRA